MAKCNKNGKSKPSRKSAVKKNTDPRRIRQKAAKIAANRRKKYMRLQKKLAQQGKLSAEGLAKYQELLQKSKEGGKQQIRKRDRKEFENTKAQTVTLGDSSASIPSTSQAQVIAAHTDWRQPQYRNGQAEAQAPNTVQSAADVPQTETQSTEKVEKKLKKKKKQKPKSEIQRLEEKAAADKAEKQAAKHQALKEAEEKQRQVAESEKQRKKEKKKFRKKTKSGQPVMKHRVDKILDQLQAT